MTDSGTAFQTLQNDSPSTWHQEEQPRYCRDPPEQTLNSGHLEESMSAFHLKHSRKELERISGRMRASKCDNLMYQLGEDANQISSAACDLIEEAGMIEFTACQLSNKAYAVKKSTMKTRTNTAALETSVASLNEIAAKIIKVAAKVCAQVAELNVNMTRISAEVNDANASKAEEDMNGVREATQEEWRRKNMCDSWGDMSSWRTDIAKSAADFRPELERRGMNKGMNTASEDSYYWWGSGIKEKRTENDSWN